MVLALKVGDVIELNHVFLNFSYGFFLLFVLNRTRVRIMIVYSQHKSMFCMLCCEKNAKMLSRLLGNGDGLC